MFCANKKQGSSIRKKLVQKTVSLALVVGLVLSAGLGAVSAFGKEDPRFPESGAPVFQPVAPLHSAEVPLKEAPGPDPGVEQAWLASDGLQLTLTGQGASSDCLALEKLDKEDITPGLQAVLDLLPAGQVTKDIRRYRLELTGKAPLLTETGFRAGRLEFPTGYFQASLTGWHCFLFAADGQVTDISSDLEAALSKRGGEKSELDLPPGNAPAEIILCRLVDEEAEGTLGREEAGNAPPSSAEEGENLSAGPADESKLSEGEPEGPGQKGDPAPDPAAQAGLSEAFGEEDLPLDEEGWPDFLPSVMSEFFALRAAPDLGLVTEAKNGWQIVTGWYAGNSQEQKIGFPKNKPEVWLQKNIVPTDTENEFKVYLSISKRAGWDELLKESELLVTTSNKYHKNPIGDEIFGGIKGNYGTASASPSGGGRKYPTTVRFKRKGRIIATKVMDYYGSVPNCNNATGFIKIQGLTFLACKTVSLQNGRDLSFTIDLDATENAGIHYLLPPAKLTSVSETLNDYLIFGQVVYVDGELSQEGGQLTWDIQENPEVSQTTYTNPKTGIYENLAQLVYTVRLDVTKPGFKSCGQNMQSKVGDPESYPAASRSDLTYHRVDFDGAQEAKMAFFPKPAVRGLLYNLKLKKVDDESHALTNGNCEQPAVFAITGPGIQGVKEVTVDRSGQGEVINLPWGDYTVTEKTPPKKFPYTYKANGDKVFSLCYTYNASGLQKDEKNMRVIGEEFTPIVNKRQMGDLVVHKKLDFALPLADEVKKVLKEDTFSFKVQLTKDGKAIPGTFTAEKTDQKGNKSSSEITFNENGETGFSLKGDDQIHLKNLPAGANYTVIEEDTDAKKRYQATLENTAGTIQADTKQKATITNTYGGHRPLPDAGGRGLGLLSPVGILLIGLAIRRYCHPCT
ncbi:MSCRAMM family protein [Peptococcus simiae]|uniref:MSCRAMM family protein n=1 Tax=Peptococcus simiae TaxID=1643805 RepID=UPI0039808528